MIPHSSPQTDLQANIKALDCVVKHMEVFESRQSLTTPKSPREEIFPSNFTKRAEKNGELSATTSRLHLHKA